MVVGAGTTNATVAVNVADNAATSLFHIKDDGNIGIGTTTPKAKVEVANGDVYVNNPANGVILKSPNGNCYRLTVNMMGNLETNVVACPQ